MRGGEEVDPVRLELWISKIEVYMRSAEGPHKYIFRVGRNIVRGAWRDEMTEEGETWGSQP